MVVVIVMMRRMKEVGRRVRVKGGVRIEGRVVVMMMMMMMMVMMTMMMMMMLMFLMMMMSIPDIFPNYAKISGKFRKILEHFKTF